MSTWAAHNTRMDAAAFKTFGVDSVYSANCTGAWQAVRVIVTEEAQRIGEGGYVVVRPEIQVQKAELPHPRKGDCLMVDGVTWLVDDVEPRNQRWLLIIRKG